MNGEGFGTTGNQSLQHLKDNNQSIDAVDGSTTYNSWADLVWTLQTIMMNEFQTATAGSDPSTWATNKPWVNANKFWYDSPDTLASHPGDHSDHVTLGQALNEFMFGNYNQAWWESYEIQSKDKNLSGEPLAHKQLVYGAYKTTMESQGFNSKDNDDEYSSCETNWDNQSYATLHNWNAPPIIHVPIVS